MRFFKLLSVMLAAGAFIAALALMPTKLCFESGESYTFFLGDSSKNCREVTVTENAGLKRLTLHGVCGEGTIYSELDLDSFLLSVEGEIVFEERLTDSVNYYCKANLPYSVNLYGEEINLHICVRENSVKVASPIIFGGY